MTTATILNCVDLLEDMELVCASFLAPSKMATT